MAKLVIVVLALIGSAFAEPPPSVGYGVPAPNFNSGSSSSSGITNEYVDEALLARVAGIYQSGGSGSFRQGNEGSQYVDSALLARISQSLGDGGSSRGISSSYGPPSRSSSSQLGQPEPAQRIAEFDLESGSFSPPSQSYSAPSNSYSPPSSSYNAPQRSTGGRISLGSPEPAQRVAAFDLSGGQTRTSAGSYTPPARNGGPY